MSDHYLVTVLERHRYTVDATVVTNSTPSAPTNDRSQVEITLSKTGDTWYINEASLL